MIEDCRMLTCGGEKVGEFAAFRLWDECACIMLIWTSCAHCACMLFYLKNQHSHVSLKKWWEGCNKDRKYMGSVCTVRGELVS